MAREEVPIEAGDRTILARRKGAVVAVVGHLVDVGRARHVGLRDEEVAQGVRPHAKHVRFYDPIVGIHVGDPEPVGERAGIEIEQRGEIREDHQPRDVVSIAGSPDIFDDVVETM